MRGRERRQAGLTRTVALAWTLACALSSATSVRAEPSLPPPPARYFHDAASFVPADVASRLNEQLAAFDRRTGRQIVVAIFPRLTSPSMEEFTVRTAQSWRVGRKGLDTGAVLFVFAEDRKLRLEVGYGLEATVPDAIAHRIIDEVIVPRLRAGTPGPAMEDGVAAILAATEGNWHPRGKPTDVPMPPAPGFHDDAALFSEPERARIATAVSTFSEQTECAMTLQVLNGDARSISGGYGADTYAGRSFYRAHPPSRPDLTDEQRWEETLAQPSAMVFMFVTARRPLKAELSFYANPTCLSEPVVNGILLAVEPRLPLAPAEALLAVPTLALQARRGVWSPPPTPTAEQFWARQEEERRAGMSVTEYAIDNALAPEHLKLWGIAFVLLFILMWKKDWFPTSGGSSRTWSSGGSSSYSSSSSSSSFSGGGGSFGGGGASGSW